jgi:hypothetical protein
MGEGEGMEGISIFPGRGKAAELWGFRANTAGYPGLVSDGFRFKLGCDPGFG